MGAAPIVLVLTGLALAGCTVHDGSTVAASGPATSESGVPATETSPPAGPTGEPFSLLTHCDISATVFGGRDRVTVTPLPEPTDLPDGSGVTSDDGYTEGLMTVLGTDLLRFVVTDPAVAEVGLSVDFVPAPAPLTSWCE